MVKKSLAALCLVLLAGCATSHVLVGTQRAPVSPDSVRVYLEPPPKFERIALLESSSEGAAFAFTNQQKTNKVMERLKAEAASLGANGILISGMTSATRGGVVNTFGNAYGNAAGASYVGTGIVAPVVVKEGSAIAIYVGD